MLSVINKAHTDHTVKSQLTYLSNTEVWLCAQISNGELNTEPDRQHICLAGNDHQQFRQRSDNSTLTWFFNSFLTITGKSRS